MNDIIKHMGNSLVQYGRYSDRVYLLKLSRDDFPEITDSLRSLAEEQGLSKIIAKVPAWAADTFIEKGYREEARIPDFYNGREDAFFMAAYSSPSRSEARNRVLIQKIIETAEKSEPYAPSVAADSGFRCDILKPEEAGEMVNVYKSVFETYPFPIFDPNYIKDTMKDNLVYFGVRDEKSLVAISSCEMDAKSENVEMTDFATLPSHRSRGLASFLLAEMENEMKRRGILTAYTIARTESYGMNITFAKHGYSFTGTLINNTNISGGIESMNVWYKPLSH